MGLLVAAVATVHTPFITGMADLAPTAVQCATEDGFQALGQTVRASRPDVVVVFTSEHVVNLSPRCAPPFLVGAGPTNRIYEEPLFALPTGQVRADARFAQGLLTALDNFGVDVAHSAQLSLDHGTVLPLHLMGVLNEVPVVPIIINSLFQPLPSLARCWALGEAVSRYVEQDWSGRVALVATGGISHSVGEPRMGAVDTAFDGRFLAALQAGDNQSLQRLTDDEIDAAGNGTHEIRNWLALRAAVADWRTDVVVAERYVEGWGTGVYQLQWSPREPDPALASPQADAHA